MIAFLAAAEHNPAVLILASMAPWFSEDVKSRSDYHKYIVGKRRLAVYKDIYFTDAAKHITAKTYILVGGGSEIKRWPAFRVRAEAAHTTIRDSELIVVPGSGHALDRQYLKAIRSVIAKLQLAGDQSQ